MNSDRQGNATAVNGNALEPIETASRDELSAVQLGRLRHALERAYARIPFYKKSFDSSGIRPADLKSLDDLAEFPFTTKDDLRRNYPFGMFGVPRERALRIHASSGTTGTPTVVGYTRSDLSVWANVTARSLRAAGTRSGDLIHNAYGYGLFTGGLGVHGGAECLGCTVVPVSGGQTERQVRIIRDFRPRVITVTPSYMLAIADEFARQGLDPRKCSLEIGIHGAETWTDAMRDEIERTFGIRAHNIYGLSEVIGPGVAVECEEERDGLHIWEDHFYPEIIDPATGKVLPEGTLGELVFTSLTREASPLVRYRTRDLTWLMAGTARPMRRMQRIVGRSDDMMIVRGVNVFPSQIEELILQDNRLSPHYRLELRRPDRLDEMTVVAEATTRTAAAEMRDAAKVELARRIKSAIGLTCTVIVSEPGSIERSQGKAQRVQDLRPGER